MASPVELQGSRERPLTPPRFAKYLVDRVRESFRTRRVAALYVATYGPYPSMSDVQCWPLWAESYLGPYPIVAHPPCGPWGPMRTLCKYQSAQCGIDCLNLVNRFGGVIEQPVASDLFFGNRIADGRLELVNQKEYGHPCEKWTWLYWHL